MGMMCVMNDEYDEYKYDIIVNSRREPKFA